MTDSQPNAPFSAERIDMLRQAARDAMSAAYCPYSNFAVGAALLCSDGSIVGGCNVENASYGLTVCAERNAVFAAVAAGHVTFTAIALVTSSPTISRPCGACRQVLAEFSPAATPIVVISESINGEYVIETVADLLPGSFSLL
ncbi:MAG TPA: cytidine deaminase [Capsulimonadaceae bacterium]|jgi:cytidine deaminase